jgi:hypothetical protein
VCEIATFVDRSAEFDHHGALRLASHSALADNTGDAPARESIRRIRPARCLHAGIGVQSIIG